MNPKNQKNLPTEKFAAAKLQQLASDILKQAKKIGATSAEVDIATGFGFNINVRKGKVENLDFNKGRELGVTLYFKNCKGSAGTSDFSKDAIDLVINKASHIAKFTNEDSCNGLADPKLMAYDYPDLDLYYPWNLSVDESIELAKICEASGFAYDKKIKNSEGSTLNNAQSFSVYANSHGFIGAFPSSFYSLSCSLIAENNNQMQRDLEYTCARDPKDLESPEVIGNKAAKLAIDRLGAKHITTRECPVIFHYQIAKTLLASFIKAISGSNLYYKTTFLQDYLGKQIFPEFINIDERPHLLKGPASAPFDNEGVITKPRFIIQNGVLQGYILNSYFGRKLNLPTTGNAGGIHNLFINTSNYDLKGLLNLMHNGLLITEILGGTTNLTTGDYSSGAFGFWVENGIIQYPVEGITIAGNLKDMLTNIIAVGNDVDNKNNYHTGSILLEKMIIAGIAINI